MLLRLPSTSVTLFALVIVLCLPGSVAGDAAQASTIESLLSQAADKNRAGMAEDAVDLAEKALELEPNPAQRAEAYFQIGVGWAHQAKPKKAGKKWNHRDLKRAERAFREAAPGGPRALDSRAYLGYVLSLIEVREQTHRHKAYDACLRLARERFDEGSPGEGMDIARLVLCGSKDCEPLPEQDNETFAAAVEDEPFSQEKHDPADGAFEHAKATSKSTAQAAAALGRQLGIRGTTVYQLIIDKEGRVANVRILKGLPLGMSDIAAREIRTWRFEPATLDGEPVSSYFNQVLKF